MVHALITMVAIALVTAFAEPAQARGHTRLGSASRATTLITLQAPFGLPAAAPAAKPGPAKAAPANVVVFLKGRPVQGANAKGVPPVAATPVDPAASTKAVPAAAASGCPAALAYLNANAAPGFIHECPGYAYGNSAMTCINAAPQCPGQKIIAIAIPCPAAYMNEASNSWVLTGVRTGPLDPYGTC